MAWLSDSVFSSIGKKFFMGLTGLAMCAFLVMHLAGNLLVFAGPDALNAYAAGLASLGALLLIAQVGLALTFLAHLMLAVLVTLENRKARPVAYAMLRSKEGRTPVSRTMIYSGLLVFAFLIVHLINFKFGVSGRDEAGRLDFYSAVIVLFQNPLYVAGYIVAMGALGLHVSHGFHSAFRSLGFFHTRYTPAIEKAAIAFGIVVAVGYSAIPLWAFLSQGGGA